MVPERRTDVKAALKKITGQIERQQQGVLKNQENINIVIKDIAALREMVAPIAEVWDDVAAVGRVGQALGSALKWCTGITISVAALWLILTKGFDK